MWKQTFTDGDTGKARLVSFPLFHMSSRLLNLTTLGGTPQLTWDHAHAAKDCSYLY